MTKEQTVSVDLNLASELSEAPTVLGDLGCDEEFGGELPPFENLPDDAVSKACDAGKLLRADFMLAWEALRKQVSLKGI